MAASDIRQARRACRLCWGTGFIRQEVGFGSRLFVKIPCPCKKNRRRNRRYKT